MNILTAYVKGCAALIAPFLYLIGMTRGLPDWLAVAALLAPLVAFGMLFPAGTVAVCLLLMVALLSMIVAMCRSQSS